MDCSLPGSSIPGILQAGILEQVAISFSRRSSQPRDRTQVSNFTHGYHQMVNTEIRLITVFVAKEGEAVYSQQKQDQELTVTQTMNYCQIQTKIEESKENH